MKSFLLIVCLVCFAYSIHLQANAFSSWLNNNNANPNTPNNAFNKWVGGNGNTSPNNAAFGNWLNNSTGGSNGANPLNDQSFINALKNQIGGGANANNQNSNDNAFRAFLQANNVPNATQLPTLQECSQYTIRAGGNVYQPNNNNYRVTCTLGNGRSYSQNCYGQANCDYLTCKFLKCSKAPGGGSVTRVKI